MSILLLTRDHSDTVFFLTSWHRQTQILSHLPFPHVGNIVVCAWVGISVEAYVLVSCTLTVVEEGSKATAVEVIQDCQQQALVKLKGCRELKGNERNETVGTVGRLEI